MSIEVVNHPDSGLLNQLNVESWPIWEKEISRFPWHYDEKEICYLLKGQVEVIPAVGEPVRFSAGDLVTFPAGMNCEWVITQAVRKHYRFGE